MCSSRVSCLRTPPKRDDGPKVREILPYSSSSREHPLCHVVSWSRRSQDSAGRQLPFWHLQKKFVDVQRQLGDRGHLAARKNVHEMFVCITAAVSTCNVLIQLCARFPLLRLSLAVALRCARMRALGFYHCSIGRRQGWNHKSLLCNHYSSSLQFETQNDEILNHRSQSQI